MDRRRRARGRAQALIASSASRWREHEHALRAGAAGSPGRLRAPADKSISHRAALLGAMASEPVRIENYLHAADTTSTLRRCARSARSSRCRRRGRGEVVIRGTGLREAREPDGPIDVGNAGTLLRLLPGWLAAQEGRSFTLDGDESIRRRPVDRIAEPLRQMGAELDATRRALPAADRARRAAARDLLRAAGRERPGQVVRAAGGARRGRRHDRRRARAQPRPHRADAAARRRRHPPQRPSRDRRQRRRAAARPRDASPATRARRRS